MRPSLLFPIFGLVLLAGCARTPVVDPNADATPAPASLRWSTVVTGAGLSLAYAPDQPSAETPPIHLSCARDPAEFRVSVEKIIPISSEDRLSVGFDGAPFAMAVTPESLAASQGVEATGPITPDLLTVMQTARVIQGSYGATRFGPYDVPPEPLLVRFVQGCRAVLEASRR